MVKKTSIFRSALAPRLLVAISQADGDGLTLRELARSVGTTDSAVQRALEPLRAGALITSRGRAHRRYVLADQHPVLTDALRLAMHELPRERLAAIVVRANRDVEFASFADDHLVVVFREGGDPRRQLSLRRTLDAVPGAPFQLETLLHGDVAERALTDLDLRELLVHGRTLKGKADELLKGGRHGNFMRARRLGRAHPSLPRLSRRMLQRLAREHDLTRISLFGSAVRADFRPSSDVDLLVRRKRDRPASLSDLARLQRDLEALLGRDVDVVEESRVEPKMKPVIDREKVVIYGRP